MKQNEIKTNERKIQCKMDDEIQNQLFPLRLSPEGDKLRPYDDNDAKVQMTKE